MQFSFYISERYLKWFLIFFNILLIIMGVLFAILGGYLIPDMKGFPSFDLGTVILMSSFELGLGVLIIFCGAFGLSAIRMISQTMMFVYAAFLLVLTLTLVGIGTYSMVVRPDAAKDFWNSMEPTLDRYGNDSQVKKSWDKAQKDFKCCGTEGADSWAEIWVPFDGPQVPDSCCINETSGCGGRIENYQDPNIHSRGCDGPGQNAVKKHLFSLGLAAICYGIILLVGALTGPCMGHIFGNVDRYISLDDTTSQ